MAAESLPTFDAPFTLRDQIEARAQHPATAEKVFLRQGDRSWTFGRFRDESVRYARFLQRRLGAVDEARPGHVAMLLENHLELLALYGGCGIAGLTLFGVNTGLGGDTLAGVLEHCRARLLVVDERFVPAVERVRDRLRFLPRENILVLRGDAGSASNYADLEESLTREVAKPEESLPLPDARVTPETNLMVIYTSGTTGLPKGINNNHFKMMATGLGVTRSLELRPDDVGYACMPLFHSNALFLGFQPAFFVGGSLALRERFSASGFLPDVLRYGVSYWNYVGEPVHYVLQAIERQFGGDEERILAEVAGHPDNHLRCTVGNGASPPDIDRFMRWFGLEEMFELYGSTEAAISTFRRRGDPRGSVGELTDEAVQILDERGKACPPADVDPDGRIRNYNEAVGEICRAAPDTALFQGYYDNPEANQSKYRDGVYHSGDLGHVVLREGRRYLYFDGRTDDWIRKDGENFSAQQVGRLLAEHPDVELAAAYGVPCPVSDELVMAALKLRPEAEFDPQAFFEFCERQVERGGMDRKWFPDFVRLVEDFEYTGTQKILVRNLKRVHFDLQRLPADARVYHRKRGDTTFHLFDPADYEHLRREFEAAERLALLER